jgi:hypothetical protein
MEPAPAETAEDATEARRGHFLPEKLSGLPPGSDVCPGGFYCNVAKAAKSSGRSKSFEFGDRPT